MVGTYLPVPDPAGRRSRPGLGKILRVKRRGDRRVMEYQTEAWDTYKNRTKDHTRKEARMYADAGAAMGCERLKTHRPTTKSNGTAPYVRGKQKTTPSTGQRRQADIGAAERAGLPHMGMDPHGTSAKCLGCGKNLGRSASWTKHGRIIRCQPCKKIRERYGNAGANTLFRTILGAVVAATGLTCAGERSMTLPATLTLLREAIRCTGISGRDHQALTYIMRLLEGCSTDANWHPSGAHKPERQSPAGGKPAGGPGVDGLGRNGPGPPNAAKLCDYADSTDSTSRTMPERERGSQPSFPLRPNNRRFHSTRLIPEDLCFHSKPFCGQAAPQYTLKPPANFRRTIQVDTTHCHMLPIDTVLRR